MTMPICTLLRSPGWAFNSSFSTFFFSAWFSCYLGTFLVPFSFFTPLHALVVIIAETFRTLTHAEILIHSQIVLLLVSKGHSISYQPCLIGFYLFCKDHITRSSNCIFFLNFFFGGCDWLMIKFHLLSFAIAVDAPKEGAWQFPSKNSISTFLMLFLLQFYCL